MCFPRAYGGQRVRAAGPSCVRLLSASHYLLTPRLSKLRLKRFGTSGRIFRTPPSRLGRTEIFLYRLQTQETVVARAFQRVAEAQSNLGEVRSNRNKLLASIKQDEEVLRAAQDSNARKELEDVIATYKAKLDASGNEEQEISARESEFAEQLRIEQAKLNELQGQLDRLDKSLQVSSR